MKKKLVVIELLLVLLLQGSIFGSDPLQGEVSTVGTLGTGSQVAVSTTLEAPVNSQPLQLQNALSSVEVRVRRGQDENNYLKYTFNQDLLAQLPATLFKNGLYVGIQVTQTEKSFPGISITQPWRHISVVLTDQNRENIYAEATFDSPQNTRGTPGFWTDIGAGSFFYAVSTAEYIFTDTKGNTVKYPNLDISTHQTVWFTGKAPTFAFNAKAETFQDSQLYYMNYILGGVGNLLIARSGDNSSIPSEFQNEAPLNQELSSYLTGLSSTDWQQGVYILAYFVDKSNRFLMNLTGVTSDNPADMYVACYTMQGQSLQLKGTYKIQSDITSDIIQGEFKVGYSNGSGSIALDYPNTFILLSSQDQSSPELAFTPQELFEGTGVTFVGADLAGVSLAQQETLTTVEAGLSFKQGGTTYFASVGIGPKDSDVQTGKNVMDTINTALQAGDVITVTIKPQAGSTNYQANLTVTSTGSATPLYQKLYSQLSGVDSTNSTGSGTTILSSATLQQQNMGHQTSNMKKLTMKSKTTSLSFKAIGRAQILVKSSVQSYNPPPPKHKHVVPQKGRASTNTDIGRF